VLRLPSVMGLLDELLLLLMLVVVLLPCVAYIYLVLINPSFIFLCVSMIRGYTGCHVCYQFYYPGLAGDLFILIGCSPVSVYFDWLLTGLCLLPIGSVCI
jgi:hypothetical protein